MSDGGRERDGETIEGVVGDWAPRDLCIAVSTGGPFQTFEIPLDDTVTVGRSSQCDILIDDPSVSRRHALLRWAGTLELQDLGSANGCVVAGARVEPGRWIELQVGEIAKIGSALLVVRPQVSVRPRRMWSHGYFESRLEEECVRSARTGQHFAVLRISIPDDASLALVEESFGLWLRAADVLARYASSEYEVLYIDSSLEQAAAATERLIDELCARANLNREQVRTGLACFPGDARSADALLTCACDRVLDVAPNRVAPVASAMASFAHLDKIAASEVSVLLLGETGVGKEVCAERIHALSRRADKKMLRLNCAALPDTLLESELFGHERGAFTGAARTKPGLLESASGGTVFLDEVGEMPLSTQVKLLRVLEERKVQRIGALDPIPLDVRFIAATNSDLDAEVVRGRFRQDLLFRLNAFTFVIPPLRARTREIEPLALHFIECASREHGRAAPTLTVDALAMLKSYAWPGNIRELRNVVERAVVLAGAGPIGLEHLPVEKMEATLLPRGREVAQAEQRVRDATELFAQPTMRLPTGPDEPASDRTPAVQATADVSLPAALEELERERITRALAECAGNQSRAAKLLGISRGTLIKRLDRFGIQRPRKPR